MTQNEHSGQASGRTNTIRHVFEIAAPPEKVFSSLTTPEGLSAWWTTKVSAGEAMVGARVQFTFGGPFNPQMQITELDPPAHLEWRGAGGHDAFGSETTIRFDLDAAGDGTRVHFSHTLGREVGDDAVASANFTWGYYLDSLRLFCETGTGKPFQPGTAGARVGADRVA